MSFVQIAKQYTAVRYETALNNNLTTDTIPGDKNDSVSMNYLQY